MNDKVGVTNIIPHIRFVIPIDETLHVGVDTRTPVDDSDYQVAVQIHRRAVQAQIKTDRPQLTPEDGKRLMEAERNNKTSD